MYKDILLAIDLNEDGSWTKAGPAAVEYAKAFGAKLHVMTVVPDFGMSIVGSFFPEGFEAKAMEATSAKLHEWVAANVPSDVEVQHVVGHGSTYGEILRTAGEIGCDLIIMAAHRSDKQSFLLGPTAARVVRHADVSVLVVRD